MSACAASEFGVRAPIARREAPRARKTARSRRALSLLAVLSACGRVGYTPARDAAAGDAGAPAFDADALMDARTTLDATSPPSDVAERDGEDDRGPTVFPDAPGLDVGVDSAALVDAEPSDARRMDSPPPSDAGLEDALIATEGGFDAATPPRPVATLLHAETFVVAPATALDVRTPPITPPADGALLVAIVAQRSYAGGQGLANLTSDADRWIHVASTFTQPAGGWAGIGAWYLAVPAGAPARTVRIRSGAMSEPPGLRAILHVIAVRGVALPDPLFRGLALDPVAMDGPATLPIDAPASAIVVAGRIWGDDAPPGALATPGSGWIELADDDRGGGALSFQTQWRTGVDTTAVEWADINVGGGAGAYAWGIGFGLLPP